MLSTNLVKVDQSRGNIATVTLNRPDKKNALSIELRDRVTASLRELAQNENIKVVVLMGEGGTFSSGFDLSEFARAVEEPKLMEEIWNSGDPYHEILLKFPLPIIAAVDGVAMGGGMDTAILCDIRIASDRASFGHPEAKFGDVVYGPLHDIVGGAIARDLCLTGRTISAAEAYRIGLVSELTTPEKLEARAIDIAETIACAPREVLLRTKEKIINRANIEFTKTLSL